MVNRFNRLFGKYRVRRSIGFIGSIIVFGVAAGVFLPGLLSAGSGLCPLRTSAQANPCLAQEGTISAQRALLLQASLDAVSYQATITALRAVSNSGTGSGSVSATSVPAKSVAFVDNFANNKRGWDLTPHDTGSASLSQGTLALNLTKGLVLAESIPGLTPDEFYLESDVTVRTTAYQTAVGYFIGDHAGNFTALTVKRGIYGADWSFVVYQFDGTHLTVTSAVPIDKELWQSGKAIRLGLNGSGGSYSLYYGGVVVASTQIVGTNKEVGFIVISENSGAIVAAFGKLVVQLPLKT